MSGYPEDYLKAIERWLNEAAADLLPEGYRLEWRDTPATAEQPDPGPAAQ
jgi:hypothetical protein